MSIVLSALRWKKVEKELTVKFMHITPNTVALPIARLFGYHATIKIFRYKINNSHAIMITISR
jgi:hypothetical protein